MIRSIFPFIAVLTSRTVSTIACSTHSPQLNGVCREIACSTSFASNVFDKSSLNYTADISHWALSSSQPAMCSFEPGTAEDLGIALQILGKSRAPFAVKGGGHIVNPGFSSTPGVQIAMTRFSEVYYNPTTETATVGAGLIWDDVYVALEEYGVNVVGGRVSGIGVAGLTLGGGYSWLTNQYGLTVDTVHGYELVLPNGTVADVREATYPDLFFALKGGFNNFGIVTSFTLKTFPQTEAWGGPILYSPEVLEQVNEATANFAAHNTDPKAAIIINYVCVKGMPGIYGQFFYDSPKPPAAVFDEFLGIPSVQNGVATRSFPSLIQTYGGNSTSSTRGVFNTVSMASIPLSLLASVFNETLHWCTKLPAATLMTYGVEPFVPTYLSHNTTPSAFPPSRTEPFFPLAMSYSWLSPTSDQDFWDAARTSASTLKAQAVKNAQGDVTNPPLYTNYAIFDTPLADLYGDNLPALQKIKGEVDPTDVMGLAGGFKIEPSQ